MAEWGPPRVAIRGHSVSICRVGYETGADGGVRVAQAVKSSMAKATGKPRRVLVVEDERDLADLIVFNLNRSGYIAEACYDGRSALDRIATQTPDLVLLDLMLPELAGNEVATRIRNNPGTSTLPIIMVTAKADEVDQLVGLTLGADDYVTKPFSVKVLLARIEAVLRRTAPKTGGAEPVGMEIAGVRIDPEAHEVVVGSEAIKLTLTEFKILSALVAAGGKVLSRQHLMTRAMGPGITVTERTIDVHVTAIRRKLGDSGGIIKTVRGVGYRATPEPETAADV